MQNGVSEWENVACVWELEEKSQACESGPPGSNLTCVMNSASSVGQTALLTSTLPTLYLQYGDKNSNLSYKEDEIKYVKYFERLESSI